MQNSALMQVRLLLMGSFYRAQIDLKIQKDIIKQYFKSITELLSRESL